MRSKRSWKDREGLSSLVTILLVIVVIAVVIGAVLYIGYVSARGGIWEPPIDDDDADDPPPLIGYFSVVAVSCLDNSGVFGEPKAYLTGLRCTFQTSQGGLSFLEWIGGLGVFGVTWDLGVKFIIDGPQQAGYHFVDTVTYKQSAGGSFGEKITYKDISPANTPGVRYHGTYHVTAQLLDVDGKQLDIKSMDISV